MAGIDWKKNRAEDTYYLRITSTEETTYTMRFVGGGDWPTGVDSFEYSRTGSISPLAAGNNSIDKATQLPNGNYGGLVTCAGDQDFYKILSVYADEIDVTVKGTGLIVREYDENNELMDTTVVEENGAYRLTVAKDHYVCVEGTADISLNECNSYSLHISDAGQAYLAPTLTATLPDSPDIVHELNDARNQVTISVAALEAGLTAYYSTDLNSWEAYDAAIVATDNGRHYYFKAVDQSGLESQFATYEVAGIDDVAPTVTIEPVAATSPAVVLTAVFDDDVNLASSLYKIGDGDVWTDYTGEVSIDTTGSTVYFKAVDAAGNETVESYVVEMDNGMVFLNQEDERIIAGGNAANILYMDGGTTTVKDGTFQANFVSGQFIENDDVTIGSTDAKENISLLVEGGSFEGYLFGADRIQTVGTLTRTGDVSITIENASITKDIAGGFAYLPNNPGSFEVLEGNIEMTILSGTFGGYIYGGCISSKKSYASATTIDGSITINLDVAAGDSISVTRAIVVGSHGPGHVTGDVRLVLSGNGSISASEIWGGCSGDFYTVSRDYETTIDGDRLLSFTGFTGNLTTGKIRAFESIRFEADANGTASEVSLNDGYNLSDIHNWEFECGSTLSGAFTNNFAGDTLKLTGFGGLTDNESRTLITSGSEATFNGFGDASFGFLMDGKSVYDRSYDSTLNKWTFSCSGLNYSLSLETNGDSSTSMILTRLA